MSFITGLLLIDAPAAALNNSNKGIPYSNVDNTTGVKYFVSDRKTYPYVSAQAFRYWLRTTLEKGNTEWKPAPVYREEKVAYTAADPIEWWDDDIFGYMRSPKTGATARERRANDPDYHKLTPLEKNSKGDEITLTRVSPLRVSTLVAIAPAQIIDDYGTMSRHNGDPVPHEHQFYHAVLQGLVSLDLHATGTFTYVSRTGYLNLDNVRIKKAQEKGLEHLESEKAYRLPQEERLKRVTALLEGLARLEGGAKQTLHYTDVSPDVVFLAVTRGGNHIFGHIFGADAQDRPTLKMEALEEALRVHGDDILSDIYVGWVSGFLDAERDKLQAALGEEGTLAGQKVHIAHPREAFAALVQALKENPDWLA